MARGVYVEGLRELNRSLAKYEKETARTTRAALKAAAEPVRVGGEHEAEAEITNIGDRWSRMRIGALSNGIYIAPKSRRRRGSPRGNLAGLLRKAMVTAVEDNRAKVVQNLERALNDLAARSGF